MGKIKSVSIPNAEFNVALNQNSKALDNIVWFNVTINAYTACIGIGRSPTGNCQVSSVAYMYLLAKYFQKDDAINVLKECYRIAGHKPHLIFMDVPFSSTQIIDSWFKVRTKTPYTSTNGNSMCLYLVESWNVPAK
jgi:hypothetical protein